MVCRTLSFGGASSIAMPLHIGGLSAQVPFIRQRETLRAGDSSPLSRIIPPAGWMCVASPSSNAKTTSSPAAVPRQAHLLPIEGYAWPGHLRKASSYVGVFVWREAAAPISLIHARSTPMKGRSVWPCHAGHRPGNGCHDLPAGPER
jgi:hypothetical protein